MAEEPGRVFWKADQPAPGAEGGGAKSSYPPGSLLLPKGTALVVDMGLPLLSQVAPSLSTERSSRSLVRSPCPLPCPCPCPLPVQQADVFTSTDSNDGVYSYETMRGLPGGHQLSAVPIDPDELAALPPLQPPSFKRTSFGRGLQYTEG